MSDNSIGYTELAKLEHVMDQLKALDKKTVDRIVSYLKDWNRDRPASVE